MKSTILMISLPLACLAAGYGAGMFLAPAEPMEPAPLAEAAPQPEGPVPGEIPPAPTDPEAAKTAEADEAEEAEGPEAPLLQVGRLTVPVLKPRSITYVVADIALALPKPELVAQVEETPETMLRMRDAVLASLTEAAQTPVMAGPAIDTDALSARVLADLKAIGMPVDEVLFPNMFKQDVARQDIPRRSASAEAAMPAQTATN